jgi:organic radical activating enzyme
MIIKGLVDEDFVNYKLPSMFVIFPFCTFKCEKECGKSCCQNSEIAKLPLIKIDVKEIVDRYIRNPISKAIVFGGLEPFDSFEEMLDLIKEFRKFMNDDIVIYTGYNKHEITSQLNLLYPFGNIIIKYGRYIPDRESSESLLLGVKLASDNQYAERLC